MKPELTYTRYHGAGIAAVFEPLADLRIAVFRDYPYLYEGTRAYELAYLKTYADSPRALLFAVFDADRLVGATTALPLSDETDEVQAPFVHAGYDTDTVFYFGESMLLPEYRGFGIGHRFFDVREHHARAFGTFHFTCFCAVQRPDDHPLRPPDYRPLDAFWRQRGYAPDPALTTSFEWPDLGATASTPKPMRFWKRRLT